MSNNCTCHKTKYYVKSRFVDGSHKLFESESKEKCLAYMREWAGENAIETGPDEMVTKCGDVVYVDDISPAKEESWDIRECWDYEKAIEHFCKKDCKECRFYESNECILEKAFGKDKGKKKDGEANQWHG